MQRNHIADPNLPNVVVVGLGEFPELILMLVESFGKHVSKVVRRIVSYVDHMSVTHNRRDPVIDPSEVAHRDNTTLVSGNLRLTPAAIPSSCA